MSQDDNIQGAVKKIQALRERMSAAKEAGFDISIAESHFSRLRYYFEKRDFGRVDGVIEQIGDILHRAGDESRKFEIYTRVLRQSMDDGIITSDENRILRAIRRRMDISEEKHLELMRKLGKPSEYSLSAYESALEQAMMDGVVTDDEQDLLDRFREAAGISMKDHLELEEKVKKRSLAGLARKRKRKSLFDDDVDLKAEEKKLAPVVDDTILEEPVEGELDIGDSDYWVEQGKILWYASDDPETDFQDIVERFQNAIELDPDNPAAWASLGSFLKKMGRLENALESFEMALRIDPTLVNPLYNKAMVLSSLGDIHKAIGILDEVLSIQPDHQHARKKKALLEKALEG